MFASVAMGMGIDLHGVDTIIYMVLQAVLKTISKLASGRSGQIGYSAYSIVYQTVKLVTG